MKVYRISNPRRFTIFIILLLVVLVVLSLLVLSFLSPQAAFSASEAEQSSSYQTYRVQYGDSLWSIAQPLAQAGEEDIRLVIYQIQEINGITSDELEAGMVLQLPSY